jgi:hypothetical protein
MQINNIAFTLQDYGQEFSFTDSTGNWHSALLQLPTTPDSQNSIDGEEWNDDEDKDAIYEELRDFFYSQYKSKEHGKASIIAGFEVTHLVELDGLYVAFNAENAVVLKEGAASSYYNVFYFELADVVDADDVIEKAKKQLFNVLSDDLEKICEEYSANNLEALSENEVKQCFDELTQDFMRSEFGTNEYAEPKISGDFYQFRACDISNDAAYSVNNK